jgi:hypothetical protein
MNKSKAKRIQHLLTKHLLGCGKISLLLPDGVSLEIGIVKDTKHGEEISDDYCYVQAKREGNSTLLDTYKAELTCIDRDNAIVCMDTTIDENGNRVKRLEIV